VLLGLWSGTVKDFIGMGCVSPIRIAEETTRASIRKGKGNSSRNVWQKLFDPSEILGVS
jgi:hypothetical protein